MNNKHVLQSVSAQSPNPSALPITHVHGDDSPYWLNPIQVGKALGLSEETAAARWRAFRG